MGGAVSASVSQCSGVCKTRLGDSPRSLVGRFLVRLPPKTPVSPCAPPGPERPFYTNKSPTLWIADRIRLRTCLSEQVNYVWGDHHVGRLLISHVNRPSPYPLRTLCDLRYTSPRTPHPAPRILYPVPYTLCRRTPYPVTSLSLLCPSTITVKSTEN